MPLTITTVPVIEGRERPYEANDVSIHEMEETFSDQTSTLTWNGTRLPFVLMASTMVFGSRGFVFPASF